MPYERLRRALIQLIQHNCLTVVRGVLQMAGVVGGRLRNGGHERTFRGSGQFSFPNVLVLDALGFVSLS